MTPRNPWRSVWRDTITPILWLIVAVVVIGYALGTAIAHADPRSSQELGDIYAQRYSGAICATLDADPTAEGVAGIVVEIQRQRFDQTTAATAIADSVFSVCPRHAVALRLFVAKYSTTHSSSVAA